MTKNKSSSGSKALTLSERVWGQADLTTMRGFLPLVSPYTLVEPQFKTLNYLLENMPVVTRDNKAGFISLNRFREESKALEDHSPVFEEWYQQIQRDELNEHQKNAIAMDLAVAFRDYQYLKMGYLFEPVHHGLDAESHLPANIANPLVLLASLFDQKPWLEYASGYVLMNSQFADEISAHKVNLIRMWHGGPDEFYFQTVHSIIEWETPQLFSAINQVIHGVEQENDSVLMNGLRQGIDVTRKMLDGLKQMTKLSRPSYYAADVRPQIQGLVGNCGEGKLFPQKGVFFDSHYFKDGQPHYITDIRGQTGAQSSIIPLLDNILGVTEFYAPGDNPLTRMLREFRSYRPKPHTELLEKVEAEQKRLNIRQYLKQKAPLLLTEWTGVICQFREFHFYLAMAYIIKPGKAQPKAQSRGIGTGGSPTPRYLPQHVSESVHALHEALAAVDAESLDSTEQSKYQFWKEYAARTGYENQSRSDTVAQYLEDETQEPLLDQAIEASRMKMQ